MAQGTSTAPLVIAVDGPGGSGKSTVAREVARRLGLRYLDTGAMYRALTWLALQRRVDVEDAERLSEMAEQVLLSVETDPDSPRVRIEGEDVTEAIRVIDKLDKLPADEVARQLVERVGATPEQAQRCLDLATIRVGDTSFTERVRALGVSDELLDEGLDFLDPGARARFLALLPGLARAGTHLLVVAHRAQDAGLTVVMDRCLKIEHARFAGGLHLAGFDTGVISSRRRPIAR